MNKCPPDDTLREYLDDSLQPDLAGPVTGHIDNCVACQQRLDGMTSESGRLGIRFNTPNPTHPTLIASEYAVPFLGRTVVHVLPVVPGYVLQEELGRGGMGVVYKALHKRLNRPAAVKMVLAGGLADPRVTQRFLFEAEILGRVLHPQVVQVYEVSMYAAPTGVTIPFLAMEYLDGGTLAEWSDGKAQPHKVAAALVEGLARAVQAAHIQGVIHRDLKPANILRTSDGTFKVTDFGLAKLTAETGEGLTGTGTILGTPAYMAPEQASGEKGIGPPADVYSLGAILFELLTGRPPFEGMEPMSVILKVIRDHPPEVRSIRADVPRDLSAVVARCLTKEPHRRYSSSAELADDLKRFCEGRPTRARSHGTAERLWYWSRRNPGTAAMLAAMFLVLTIGFISVMVLWRRAEGNAEAMGRAVAIARLESEEAERQRDDAAKQRHAADRQGAYLAFDQATHWCENGQIDDGLRGFVRALELAEGIGEQALAHVVRVNIAAWERELYPPGKLFRIPDNSTLTASGFSPDGKWVFAAGTDTVQVWDADTGERVTVLTDAAAGHVISLLKGLPFTEGLVDPPGIRAVAISTDRTRVAAVLSSGDISIWDITATKPRRTFHPAIKGKRTSDLWAAEFDQEGHLWVGGDGGVLALFNVETGREVRSLAIPKVGQRAISIQSLRLSGNGKTLYTGDRAGRLLAWDLASGAVAYEDRLGGWVGDIGLSEVSPVVAMAGTNGAAVIARPRGGRWDIPTNGAYASTIQFALGDRLVVLGDQDGRAQVWDTGTRATTGGPLHLGMFLKKLVCRPGRSELLVPTDGGVRLQPLAPSLPLTITHDWPVGRVRVLDFSSRGDRLLVGAGRLSLNDTKTGRFVSLVQVNEEAISGRFLGSGKHVLFGLRTGWRVFDIERSVTTKSYPSRDYVSLITSDPTGTATRIYLSGLFQSVSTEGFGRGGVGRLKGVDLRHSRPSDACLAPGDGEVRFSLFDTIRFHDLSTGDVTRPLLRAPDEIRALAQTPDGTRVVAGLNDNSLQVWDVKTGKTRYALPPRHELTVTAVAVSPDARVILSGSRDRTARFWDFETGLVLGPRLRHADAVTHVAYSPTERRVATGTSEGRAAIWSAPPDPIQDTVENLRVRYASLKSNSFPVKAVFK